MSPDENPEIRPQRRLGFVRGVAVRAVVLAPIVGGIAAAACGGNSEGGEVKTSPSSNPETASPTQTFEPSPIPTVTEAPELKKLADAAYVPTDFETMIATIDAAYQAHPDANSLDYQNAGVLILSRENLNTNIELCRNGNSQADKDIGCANLITLMDYVYEETSYGEFYQIEISVANYHLTEFPEATARQRFDNLLLANIKDTSPR